MKNKKYEEDLDLLEQLASLATKKNLSEIEFKKGRLSYFSKSSSKEEICL